MKTLKISDFDILKQFNKIIVTGPPRSGTTISAMIIAKEINYKFIDESFYDSNNPQKFMYFLAINRKMVVHTTAFLRDLHTISNFLNINNIAIVLIRRSTEDILESFENTKKFTKDILTSNGIFKSIDDEAEDILFKHFRSLNKDTPLPEVIYNHFDNNKYLFNQNKLFEVYYDDLSGHKLFVEKKIRREKFVHIKQVNPDDPYYLQTKKGVMVL